MGLVKTQWEFVKHLAMLVGFADSINVMLTGGELYRTEDQQELYFNGKTVRVDHQKIELETGVKRTKTMNSDHLKRLAQDYNIFVDGVYTTDNKNEKLIMLGEFWEALHPNNYWGGFFKSFNDSPHFGRKA